MVNNPLSQYFRQPKIYISLPSKGVYNMQGSIQGDPTNLPIFGMTGMDEILLKTPDALITGESTVKVIESCCPGIKNGWDISVLDTSLILIAIRIATFGDELKIGQTCTKCNTDNEYEIKLTSLIDHYNSFKFNNKLVLKDLTIVIRPLTYKESTDFSLKNFELQQKLAQLDSIADRNESNLLISQLFEEIGTIQRKLFMLSIESINIGSQVVNEREFIEDWLKNCDQTYYDHIKTHINMTNDSIQIPPYTVQCSECGAENKVIIDLDQSTFFEKA